MSTRDFRRWGLPWIAKGRNSVFDDPAVRSIRVAVALSERFAELLKGPAVVSAHKKSGALFGVSGNEEALSLRIGEAQQLYPEIWRHLDDARAVMAERGADVSAYDRIRTDEGAVLGAAVDVDRSSHGVGQHRVHHQVKSANFNREGHARACSASAALMKAAPKIDWAAIERAEVADPAIAEFQRATRRKRALVFTLMILVIAAPLVWRFLVR